MKGSAKLAKKIVVDGTGITEQIVVNFRYSAICCYSLSIFEAAIISIIACILSTAIPLRFIAKMNIVASIETVE